MRNHQEANHEARHNFFQSFGQVEQEACDNLRNCAYEMQHFGIAAARGALETAEKRIQKDPVGLAAEVGTAVIAGLAIGAVAEVAAPVAAGAVLFAGADYAWHTLNPATNAHRNEVLGKAWNAAWNCKDETKVKSYFDQVAKEVGPQVFDFTVCTLAAGAGAKFAGPRANVVEYEPTAVEGPQNNLLPFASETPVKLEPVRIPSETLKARVQQIKQDGQFAKPGEEMR